MVFISELQRIFFMIKKKYDLALKWMPLFNVYSPEVTLRPFMGTVPKRKPEATYCVVSEYEMKIIKIASYVRHYQIPTMTPVSAVST